MTEYSWQDVKCPLCPEGSRSSNFLKCNDRLADLSQTEFTLRRCETCKLVFLSPKPDQKALQSAYQSEGYDPFQSLRVPTSAFDCIYRIARGVTLVWKKKLVQKLASLGSRILDVGCGTGEFLNSLKDSYQVTGYEPELRVARWVQEEYGLSIYAGDSTSLPGDIEHFDLITLWHVLEHIPDPVNELHRLALILKPNGKLLIALPNISSADAAIYGSSWVALDAPRHLWHFSKEQIGLLAKLTGFELIKVGMLPLDVFYNSLLSEKIYLTNNSFSQLALAPFRIFTAVISSLMYGMITKRHSSNYYVLAKK